jgi:hypothetical protein
MIVKERPAGADKWKRRQAATINWKANGWGNNERKGSRQNAGDQSIEAGRRVVGGRVREMIRQIGVRRLSVGECSCGREIR